MALSTFRRSTTVEAAKKGKGGKGQRGNWRDRYRIPQNVASPFIMQAHEFADPNPDPKEMELAGVDVSGKPNPVKKTYYKFRKHKRKTVVNGVQRFFDEPCSAGYNPHNPQPCAGCMAMDMGDKSVGVSDTFALGIIHLHPYHGHPVFDQKTNQWMQRGDGSGLVLNYEECTGKTCNYCRILSGQQPVQDGKYQFPLYPPETLTTVFGSRRYLELGKGHLADLGAWDQQIGSQCGGVKYARDPQGNWLRDAAGNAIPIGRCNSQLEVDGYACPQCNTLLIDAAQDPRTLQQLDELVLTTPLPCPKCQKAVYAKEVVSCSQCGSAQVNGLFGGVVWGMRQGEDTQSHLVLGPPYYQTVEEFEAGLPQGIRALLNGKSLKERIEELDQQYDFDGLFKPRSVQDQAKRLHLDNLPIQGQPSGYGQQMAPQGGYGYPAPPQQQFMAPAPAAPAQAYQPYGAPTGPGPAPFAPPTKPNFGQ